MQKTLSGHPIGSKEDMEFHRATGQQIPKVQDETLEQALKRCYGNASKTLYSQAKLALMGLYGSPLHSTVGDVALSWRKVASVTQQDVQRATSVWYGEGLSPATINKRLNCLSKMGVSVEGLRVKNPKSLKWHLPESLKPELLVWLREMEGSQWHILADFIEWTTLTGLRIEETLRLNWSAVRNSEVIVPGTKTATSQATLPLGETAIRLLKAMANRGAPGDIKVFRTDYDELQTCWEYVRTKWGWKDDPTATLKALRRSAARYLHVDCGMPLHMVQQYLRHESMDTTLEYLRLTGGYGTEEMRRYLK